MSLRETLGPVIRDLNPSGVVIDKDDDYKGRKATKVSFRMTDPLGLDTGPLTFEIWLANDLGLSNEEKANLVYSYASAEASAFVMDKEVEV